MSDIVERARSLITSYGKQLKAQEYTRVLVHLLAELPAPNGLTIPLDLPALAEIKLDGRAENILDIVELLGKPGVHSPEAEEVYTLTLSALEKICEGWVELMRIDRDVNKPPFLTIAT